MQSVFVALIRAPALACAVSPQNMALLSHRRARRIREDQGSSHVRASLVSSQSGKFLRALEIFLIKKTIVVLLFLSLRARNRAILVKQVLLVHGCVPGGPLKFS